MAKRKLTATQKMRNNVKRQIRRMEERGYRIEDAVKEKLETAPYQTLKSYQKNRYTKLYGESTALSDEGKIVSGEEYRHIERTESAQKAVATRASKRNKSTPVTANVSNWEEARIRQDEIDRQNAKYYSEGEIAYDQITSLIDQYPTKGAESLNKALSSEIRKYGKKNVLMAMGQVPDMIIDKVTKIVYYQEDADAIHSAFVDMFSIITGTKISDEEARMLGDTLDEMTDIDLY